MTPEAEMFLVNNRPMIREAIRQMELENAAHDLDLESACIGVLHEADYVSCARPEQLALHRGLLVEARDHLNHAIEKAETAQRKAA